MFPFYLLLFYNREVDIVERKCSMSEKTPFTKEILNKGKQLYAQGKVIEIKKEKNVFHVIIEDQDQNYLSSVALNEKNKVIGMKCHCSYAKSGQQCAHEAAAIVAVSQYLKEMRIVKIETYKEHVAYLSQLKTQVKDIFDKYKNNEDQLLIEIRQLYEEFNQIQYNTNYRYFVVEAFENILSRIKGYKNSPIFLEWAKKSLIQGTNLGLIHEFKSAIACQLPQERIDMVVEILAQTKLESQNYVIAQLFKILKDTLKKNEYEVNEEMIDQLSRYQDLLDYLSLQVHFYLSKKEYEKAQEAFNQFQHNHFRYDRIETYKLQAEIYYQAKDADNYRQLLIDYMRNFNEPISVSSIHKMKEIYGEKWGEQRNEFYDHLKVLVSETEFRRLMKKVNDVEGMIHLCVKYASMDILLTYQNQIMNKDKNLFYYLYSLCIYKKMQSESGIYSIRYYLNELRRYGCQQEGIDEIIYRLRHDFSDNERLMGILDEEEQDEDEDI